MRKKKGDISFETVIGILICLAVLVIVTVFLIYPAVKKALGVDEFTSCESGAFKGVCYNEADKANHEADGEVCSKNNCPQDKVYCCYKMSVGLG